MFKENNMSGNKKGFTLIELLIVVVIIGILAAIAIPKFTNTKEKAYLAAMKSDLRNLATYEESYAADYAGAYFAGPANGGAPGVPVVTLNGFTPSGQVSVVITTAGTSWSADANHAQLTTKTCSMSTLGQITCT
jgi:prepilin-type N-terminal cleavage/methylation domain-containing protein